MASRFWAAGSSSEEEEEEDVPSSSEEEESSSGSAESSSDSDGSSSDSDSDSSSDESRGPGRFIKGGDSDSDSDDDERKVVLKSAKDKRFEELTNTCQEIRNKKKNNDWSSIQSLFDELNKRLERTQKVTDSHHVPRAYLRILIELEDFLNETLANKDLKKSMKSTNAKALNTMRQRLKKHNLQYADELQKLRENPVDTDEEDQDDSSSESSSSEDDEESEQQADGTSHVKKKDKLLTMDPAEITYEMVNKKLREIIGSRGKRGTDKQEQVEMLAYLVTVAKGPAQKVEVIGQLVSSLFNLSPGVSNYMKVSVWKKCVANMLEMLDILNQNPHIRVDEQVDMSDMNERTEEPAAGAEVKVWGSVVAFVERLDDELFKSLQVIDPHTHDYMTRLKDEPVLLALAQQAADYCERTGEMRNLSKMALRLVEHFYYKTDRVYDAMWKLVQLQQAAGASVVEAVDDGDELLEPDEENIEVKVPASYTMHESCHAVMQSLVTTVFRHGDDRTKVRATLCHIFHKALHGQFYLARDLLLMSHLQDGVHNMDISTQILHNRTIAQLGLAAFRNGLIADAHQCIAELYGSGHIKELLAQGISMNKYQEKTVEQELLEKRRQMPFHMHVTLELLETVYLTAAMLIEVPKIASNPLNPKKGMVSKAFHRILDTYSRQTFTGPPENVRDHIMAATRAMVRGDWQKAYTYVSALSAWNLLPQKAEVLEMVQGKLQEESLRTYLATYSAQYKSLSLDQLCSMFQLPEQKVYSIVSKMIVSEELAASWDQPTRTIIMHSMDASRVQHVALQLMDKAATLVDLNERALAMRTGRMQGDDDDEHQRRGRRYDNEEGGGRSRGAKLGMGVRIAGPGQGGRGMGREGRGGGGMRGGQQRMGFRTGGERYTGYERPRGFGRTPPPAMATLGPNLNRPNFNRDNRERRQG